MMDRLSHLPDDLLLKIFSFSLTKEVPITSVLSKRWRPLWMLVPKIEYCCRNNGQESFSKFVSTSLLLHKVPVLESLHLYLDQTCSDTDIESCLAIASNRNLRELKIDFGLLSSVRFPRRMCETLVVLHLWGVVLNVTLIPGSFLSLKTLHLRSMTYKGNKASFRRLLSKCPVLEDLLTEYRDSSQMLTIRVPSLQRLSVRQSPGRCFRLETPSLQQLKIDTCVMRMCYIENMPHLETADIRVFSTSLSLFPGSLTSAKRLSLCLVSPRGQVPRIPSRIFHRLLHLTLCTVYPDWPSYLKWMIEASPNLQTLKLHNDHLTKPSVHLSDTIIEIPECSLPHLQTFEWRGYQGTPQNRKLVSYILINASNLNKAIISTEQERCDSQHTCS